MRPAQVLGFGLHRAFGPVPALDGVDLTLEGGIVAVLGPNGAGKTTLLRCLATVDRPDDGSLLIDGMNPAHESDRIEIRRRLGYQPQTPRPAPRARVFDVVDYLAVLKGHREDRPRRLLVRRALDEVGLADRARDRVEDLSGGMRQRLGVAQALLGQPTLLLLDEPAAGLDPDERFRLREALASRRHRATVVVSTHLTDEAAMADTVLVLTAGRLRFAGRPESLARTAEGRVWSTDRAPEPSTVRASWRQADGSHRCVGAPPPGARLVPPTLEDGYLLMTR